MYLFMYAYLKWPEYGSKLFFEGSDRWSIAKGQIDLEQVGAEGIGIPKNVSKTSLQNEALLSSSTYRFEIGLARSTVRRVLGEPYIT